MFKNQPFASCAVCAILLPAGAMAQEATQDAGQDNVTTVVVFGQHAATQRSIEQKKKADNSVEVITANDAGKLPDQNVAETVRRASGVAAANDQGEGRYVVIRGLDPNLAAVRINGQSAAAPEPEGRQVKLDDIPSGLVGQVTVIKNQTADLDANAIAGAVDIKTLSAFDRKGTFFTSRFAAGHYELNDKSPTEADATFGTRFGADKNFGVVLSINASRRPIRSNNVQGSSNWTTGANGFTTPDDFRPRDYNLIRSRSGAAATFDWKPNDGAHLFARVLSSKFSDDENRDQFRIALPTSGLTNQTATSGDFTGAAATRFVRRRKEVDRILTTSLRGDFTVGAGKLSVVATASQSTKEDPLRSEWQFKASGIDGHYDTSDDLYVVTPVAKAYDATQYKASSFNIDVRKAEEKLGQFATDYSLPVNWVGEGSEFKVGVKYSDRHKTNERDYKAYKMNTAFLLSAAGPTVDDDTTFDGRYAMGPLVNYSHVLSYATSINALKYDAAGSIANSLGVDYDVSEKIAAAYAMLTIHSGKLTVIPGLRVEDTKSDYKAKSFTPSSSVTQDFNVFGDNHYTDLFPSLVGRYDLSDSTVLRFAATTAIGRPNYADLAPYVNDDGASNVALGNPDLKPLKSVNLDAGYEHYVGKSGLLSASLFYKAIDNPIYSAGTNSSPAYPGDLVTQPKNAEKAHVSGIEFNAIYQFDSLPSPFDGLGVNANVTLQDASAQGTFARSGDVPLFYTSDTTGTAQITYEKYGVLARLAYTYRSAYLDTVGADKAHDLYTDANGQLDAKLSYAMGTNWLVYVEGTNLNDAPWRRYQAVKHQMVEQENYGSSWKIGLSNRF